MAGKARGETDDTDDSGKDNNIHDNEDYDSGVHGGACENDIYFDNSEYCGKENDNINDSDDIDVEDGNADGGRRR